MEKVCNVVRELPIKELNLDKYSFRFGFPLYKGVKGGEDDFIPIPINEGYILEWQLRNSKKPCWPIKESEKGEYYLANVKLNVIDPPSESMPTDQYLSNLVVGASCYNKTARKTLEAFKPYATLIKNQCGDDGRLYQEIKKVVPDFPDV